jgi:hypothetical protein
MAGLIRGSASMPVELAANDQIASFDGKIVCREITA